MSKIVIYKRTLYILCLLNIIIGIFYITLKLNVTSTWSHIMFITFYLGGISLIFLFSIIIIIISIKYKNIYHTKKCLIISIIIFLTYFVFILYRILVIIYVRFEYGYNING